MRARARRAVMAGPLFVGCVPLVLVACTQQTPVGDCRPEAASVSVHGCPTVTTGSARPSSAVVPDDQAVVTVSPPGSGFAVSVPQGWLSTKSATATTFTNGANTIQLEMVPRAAEPTVESEDSRTAFSGGGGRGSASQVLRKAGPAILVRFAEQRPVDPVTGISTSIVIERYQFWKSGHLAVLTFSSPREVDNTRFWLRISDTFTWTQ